MNEMDVLYKGDWRQQFYGANFERLLAIEEKLDPDALLCAYTAVGIDAWTLDGNGRLCQA